MRIHRTVAAVGIVLGALIAAAGSVQAQTAVKHVVLISIDGLRSDALRAASPKRLPHFYQLMAEGAGTLNARTDSDFTITIPNHTCMLTGRGVAGPAGHGVIINTDTDKTVQELKGSQVDSIFNVLREHELTSAMSASKLKFKIYQNSYPIDHVHLTDQRDDETITDALSVLGAQHPPAFTFIHFSNPDHAGHQGGWSVSKKSPYMQAVLMLDGQLGRLMDAVNALNTRGETTVIIVTADHGGTGKNHQDAKDRLDYTVPFWVWGAGIAKGKDLYRLNEARRADPGTKQISYDRPKQPIRNGDAANLALHLLGQDCVPQSTIGCFDALGVGE